MKYVMMSESGKLWSTDIPNQYLQGDNAGLNPIPRCIIWENFLRIDLSLFLASNYFWFVIYGGYNKQTKYPTMTVSVNPWTLNKTDQSPQRGKAHIKPIQGFVVREHLLRIYLIKFCASESFLFMIYEKK